MSAKWRAAHAAWCLLAVTTVMVTTLGFVDAWADPRALGSVVPDLAEELGLSPRLPMVVGLMIPALGNVLLACFVVSRRPRDPTALLFAVMLVTMFAGLSARAAGATFVARPWSQPLVLIVWFAAYVAMGWFLATFPDGRLTPRWGVAAPVTLAGAFVAYPRFGAAYIHLPEQPPAAGRFAVALLLIAAAIAIATAAQIARYRRVASPTQRQQSKWGVLPFLLLMLLGAIQFVSNVFGSSAHFNAVVMLLMVPVLLFMPLAWAFAILRYRLYDIDRLISRSLSYVILTALLLALYGGVVFALQEPLRPIVGESQAAVAAATLSVAAVFRPLRRRIQNAVDRRFNRAGYDAQQAADRFRSRLRTDIDLHDVDAELVDAVRDTLAPSRVSLWLLFDAADTPPPA